MAGHVDNETAEVFNKICTVNGWKKSAVIRDIVTAYCTAHTGRDYPVPAENRSPTAYFKSITVLVNGEYREVCWSDIQEVITI